MARARAHHYLPQVYLRSWTDEKNRVAARRRAGSTFLASTKNVAQESDLYTVETAEGPSDQLERELSKVESHLPDFLRDLRQRKIPRSGTSSRQVYSRLLALQFIRTPDRVEVHLLPQEALDLSSGQLPVTAKVVRPLLEERWGHSLTEDELGGALDFINLCLSEPMRNTYTEFLQIQFATLTKVARVLESLRWSVEISKGRRFVVSDQPLAIWRRRPDPYSGGLEEADEVRFPVGPNHLLVLRQRGHETAQLVTRARVDSVNEHAAATCRHLLLAAPEDIELLRLLPLRRQRPTLKINKGPGYEQWGETTRKVGDILHIYRPYDDRPLETYPPPRSRRPLGPGRASLS